MLSDDELGVRLRTRLHDEVAEVTAAPDLTGALRRRARRVAAARVGVMGAVVAVVGAGAVVAAGGADGPHVPGSDPPSARQEVYDVSYVSAQTDAALANATDFVLRTEVTVPAAAVTYVVLTDLQTNRSRFDSLGVNGPMYSQASTPVPGAALGTDEVLVVDHTHRSWWSHTVTPPTLPGEGPAVATPSFHDPAEIRDAMSSGELTLVGSEQIDGDHAWHLRGSVLRDGSSGWELNIWVDSQTYLPMRIVATKPNGDEHVADLTWLPRTAENLALLEVEVPDGYTYHDQPIVPEPGQPVG